MPVGFSSSNVVQIQRFALEWKACLTNVTGLQPSGEDFRWYLKTKCSNCGEERDWIYLCKEERVEVTGSRGTANIVIQCKMCKRENSIDFVGEAATYDEDDDQEFVRLAKFDCRGVELLDWDRRGGFVCKSTESSSEFEVDFSDGGDWADYDVDGQAEVSIMDAEHRFLVDKMGKKGKGKRRG